MDKWDEGYTDGFREAMMTVQELGERRPDIKVGDVLDALEAERSMLLTPMWRSGAGDSCAREAFR